MNPAILLVKPVQILVLVLPVMMDSIKMEPVNRVCRGVKFVAVEPVVLPVKQEDLNMK